MRCFAGCVGGKKRTLDVFFSAKKAKNERWEVVEVQLDVILLFGGQLNTFDVSPSAGISPVWYLFLRRCYNRPLTTIA